MGEQRRREMSGFPRIQQLAPGQQIQIDLSKATQNVCPCGSKYFVSVIESWTVSALVSPTGQELHANRPALVCSKCHTPLWEGSKV